MYTLLIFWKKDILTYLKYSYFNIKTIYEPTGCFYEGEKNWNLWVCCCVLLIYLFLFCFYRWQVLWVERKLYHQYSFLPHLLPTVKLRNVKNQQVRILLNISSFKPSFTFHSLWNNNGRIPSFVIIFSLRKFYNQLL